MRLADKMDDFHATQDFEVFSRLPNELQDLIWKHAVAMEDDRIVELRTGPKTQVFSSCPIPALLHVSQDSRQIALKRWKPSIAAGGGGPEIFFDQFRDTLFFGDDSPTLDQFAMAPYSGAGVQKIAFSLESQWGDTFNSLEERALNIHAWFPDLQHITFLDMNADFDFEAHARGEPQPEAISPRDRLIKFESMPGEETSSEEPRVHRRLLKNLRSAFERLEIVCPTWDRLDYRYVQRR